MKEIENNLHQLHAISRKRDGEKMDTDQEKKRVVTAESVMEPFARVDRVDINSPAHQAVSGLQNLRLTTVVETR